MALQQVEPKKIYIRVDEQGWQPGANTLLYVPMKTNFDDMSGNNWTLTNNNVTIQNVSGVTCGYFDGTNYITTNVNPQDSYDMTYSVWARLYDSGNGENWIIGGNPSGQYKGEYFAFRQAETVWVGIVSSQYYNYISYSGGFNIDTWYHVCYANKNLYVNGTLVGTMSYSGSTYTAGNSYIIGRQNTGANSYKGYMSELIIESRGWTAQEVLNYYNQTKGDYGL